MVLIYVDDDCRICVDVLSSTKGDDIDASRIVVVAAADAADAPALRASRIAWPQERVYVDVTGDFAARLQLQGVPVMLGLVNDEIHWRWSGALPQSNLRSLLASWLDSHPAPAPAQ